jgi:hypothetical protein
MLGFFLRLGVSLFVLFLCSVPAQKINNDGSASGNSHTAAFVSSAFEDNPDHQSITGVDRSAAQPRPSLSVDKVIVSNVGTLYGEMTSQDTFGSDRLFNFEGESRDVHDATIRSVMSIDHGRGYETCGYPSAGKRILNGLTDSQINISFPVTGHEREGPVVDSRFHLLPSITGQQYGWDAWFVACLDDAIPSVQNMTGSDESPSIISKESAPHDGDNLTGGAGSDAGNRDNRTPDSHYCFNGTAFILIRSTADDERYCHGYGKSAGGSISVADDSLKKWPTHSTTPSDPKHDM